MAEMYKDFAIDMLTRLCVSNLATSTVGSDVNELVEQGALQ